MASPSFAPAMLGQRAWNSSDARWGGRIARRGKYAHEAAASPFMAAHAAAVARHAAGCDLVHAHWTLSAAAAIAGRIRHKAPVLLTSQGSDLFRASRGRVGATVTRASFVAVIITVLSRALRDPERSPWGWQDRLTIIPNGVDTTAFRPVPVERKPARSLCRLPD